MNKYEIVKKLEDFAPAESAEVWDCVGFAVETPKKEVSKIMFCLTPTEKIVGAAKEQNCDMIISHHPVFYVPLSWSDIDIYCAHTNLDKAHGGTTDTIIENLGLNNRKINPDHEFLRFVEFETPTSVDDFATLLKTISKDVRLVNNNEVKTLKRIAFCAGSGSEFIEEARQNGADCLVTGDLKFHTALESQIVLFDIGHFESEILILPVLKKLVGEEVETVFAQEKSPFIRC